MDSGAKTSRLARLKLYLLSCRFVKGMQYCWFICIVLLGVYLVSSYLLPLYGYLPSIILPFKVPLEIGLCCVSVSSGITAGLQKLALGQPSMDMEDAFLMLRREHGVLGTCCLEIGAVPSSVYVDDTGKTRYRDGMLLALRSGLDKSATIAFEAGVDHGAPFLRLFITASSNEAADVKEILRTEATRAEAILLASLNTVEMKMLSGNQLRNAIVMSEGESGSVDSIDSYTLGHVSLMTLTGQPRVLPHHDSSQVGTFVSTLLKQGYNARMCCVFSASGPGRETKKLESKWRTIQARERRNEESLKDHATKKQLISRYGEIGEEGGWFDCSVRFTVIDDDEATRVRTAAAMKAVVVSIWGGESSLKVEALKIRRKTLYTLLARRHLSKQKLHSSQVAAFVNTPVEKLPTISSSQVPSFEVPSPESVGKEIVVGRAVFASRTLFEVGLETDWLREHVAILGSTGTGKTTVVKNIIRQLSEKTDVPWWVFDLKGSEYSDLVALGDVKVIRPGLDNDFAIELVDSETDSDGIGGHSTFVMLRELLKERGDASDLSPAMEKLLRESIVRIVSHPGTRKSVQVLFDTINEVSGKDRMGSLTRDALLNRLEVLKRSPMGKILGGGSDATDLAQLMTKRVVFDLRHVAKIGGMDSARLLYNLVAKRIFDYAMKRGIVEGLHHVVVLEEANNLVPESYTRNTAADVTTGESMVMLQRATGQGVLVVSTRPNISSNILANTATKIIFRLPYDSKTGERFLSLSEEQGRYLTSLKRGRALMSIPHCETFEIATLPFDFTEPVREVVAEAAKPSPQSADVRTTEKVTIEHDSSDSDSGVVIFDRLGQYGNHLVAHLASAEMATEDEIRNILRSLDSSAATEDLEEVLHDLVSFGTIERDSFSLVPGGVIYTLPGRSPHAIRRVIVDRILSYVEDMEDVTVSEPGSGMPDLILTDRAILIQPEHLKSSMMRDAVRNIRKCMENLGTGINNLYVVVRGSVAAARLRDSLGSKSEFEDVTVVSAFPSSIESMMEGFSSTSKSLENVKEPPEQLCDEDSHHLGLLDAMHDVGSVTSRAVQIRLWFELIQEFVSLSGGQVLWESILEFIETTSLQSVKGRTAPLMKDEGKRALTELLADEVLTAVRIGEDIGIQDVEKGLWIANSSVLRDLKAGVIKSFEVEFMKRGQEVKRDHGYYDFCVGSTSYVIFPTQQQLSTLMNLHNDIACRKCDSVRVICILTAAEYLEDNAITPSNLTILTMEDNVAASAV